MVSYIVPMIEENIVIDTNVILSGLSSLHGFSYKLLERIPDRIFNICISVPLIMEYESVLLKHNKKTGLNETDIRDYIDYICDVGIKTEMFYLWRPILKDPYDDHVLELAVASGSKYLVTFNRKDFLPAEKFDISVVTPKEYLRIGGMK